MREEDDKLERSLISALQVLRSRNSGYWILAGKSDHPDDRLRQIAAVARRRWTSRSRRGISDDASRADLTDGLIAQLVDGSRPIGSERRDWEWLANALIDAIAEPNPLHRE